MPSSPDYPTEQPDDQADGLAFYNDVDEDENGEKRPRRILDLDSPSALPVLIDESTDADSPSGNLDLDDEVAGIGNVDISALIQELETSHARGQRRRPTTPERADSPGPTAPAPGPVYDLASKLPEPVQRPEDAREIARLRVEIETERNNVRRRMADLVNFRRKAEHDRDRAVEDTLARVFKKILPVFDDFERSLGATSETRNYDQLKEGVQAILRNFASVLSEFGIEPIDSTGRIFDPDLHEVVGVNESSNEPEDTIVEDLRRGYLIDGRLLRAAMVLVAGHAPAETPGEVAAEVDSGIESVQSETAEQILSDDDGGQSRRNGVAPEAESDATEPNINQNQPVEPGTEPSPTAGS